MISLLERMNEAAGEAFAAAGYPEVSAKVTLSNRPDLCEYQCKASCRWPARRSITARP